MNLRTVLLLALCLYGGYQAFEGKMVLPWIEKAVEERSWIKAFPEGMYFPDEKEYWRVHDEMVTDVPRGPYTGKIAGADTDRDLDSADGVFNSDGTLKRLPAGTKYYVFTGTVETVNGGTFILRGVDDKPGRDHSYKRLYYVICPSNIPPTPLNQAIRFNGILMGMHGEVQEVLYLPPDALPANAGDGTWMWKRRRTQLDAPAR